MFAFLVLSTSPGYEIKPLAIGIAAGIILDATVIRALLVPALMRLMGEANWWMPRWTHRTAHPSPRAVGTDRSGDRVMADRSTWVAGHGRPATHDVVVVGGGAAGLSAALVLGRARRQRVAVIDAGAPRNAPAAHMQGFLSRDGMPPPERLPPDGTRRRVTASRSSTTRRSRSSRASPCSSREATCSRPAAS